MKKSVVYLCGTISDEIETATWRTALVERFHTRIAFRNPLRGKEWTDTGWLHQLSNRALMLRDLRDIDASDFLVVNCPGSVLPTPGTAMEMFYAWTKRIPVLYVTPVKTHPWIDEIVAGYFDSPACAINFILDSWEDPHE